MRKIDEKKVKDIVDLRNEGYSISATAKIVGVSQGTVVRYSKKGKVKVKQSRVAKPKAVVQQTTAEPLTMDLLPDFLSGYLDGLSVRFNVPRSQIDDIVISRLETKIDHCSGWISLTWIFGGGLLLALLSHLS
jgi:hypothetical protein